MWMLHSSESEGMLASLHLYHLEQQDDCSLQCVLSLAGNGALSKLDGLMLVLSPVTE